MRILHAGPLFLAGLLMAGIPYVSPAANWDVHPGVYAAYEHTDNYLGAAHDGRRESTYEVGPSLNLVCTTPSLIWELSGYAARSYHRRYKYDESPEERLESTATLSDVRNTLTFDYAYVQTRRRESLDQAWGLLRTLSGGVLYERRLSPSLSTSVGYTLTNEYAPYPDDDVASREASLGLSAGLGPRSEASLRLTQAAHRYDTDPDTQASGAEATYRYALTPRLGVGLESEYEHHREDRSSGENRRPGEDIYRVALFADHTLSPNTDIRLSLGQGWFHRDRSWENEAGIWYRYSPPTEETITLSAELHHEISDQTLVDIALEQGYAYEYTAYRSGVSETRSAEMTLSHILVRTVSGTIDASLEQRTPPFNEPVETDLSSSLSLTWSPWQYLDARIFYEHLQFRRDLPTTRRNQLLAEIGPAGYQRYAYGSLDPRAENRYGMSIEVRY